MSSSSRRSLAAVLLPVLALNYILGLKSLGGAAAVAPASAWQQATRGVTYAPPLSNNRPFKSARLFDRLPGHQYRRVRLVDRHGHHAGHVSGRRADLQFRANRQCADDSDGRGGVSAANADLRQMAGHSARLGAGICLSARRARTRRTRAARGRRADGGPRSAATCSNCRMRCRCRAYAICSASCRASCARHHRQRRSGRYSCRTPATNIAAPTARRPRISTRYFAAHVPVFATTAARPSPISNPCRRAAPRR